MRQLDEKIVTDFILTQTTFSVDSIKARFRYRTSITPKLIAEVFTKLQERGWIEPTEDDPAEFQMRGSDA